jgi:para-aminobenzoate synthetase/4-amino-4-deoxychorismate lyase
VRVEASPLSAGAEPRRVALAPAPVDGTDPFLFHKTTHRRAYDDARRSCPGFDDVLMWNEREEVTESTIANVVVEIDGALWTPPVACGLLAGVQRGWLVERGLVRERVLSVDDVLAGARVYLVNSVRGMWRVEVVDRRALPGAPPLVSAG